MRRRGMETMGGGCVMADVGRILAIYSVIDTAASESEKTQEANQVRAEITAIRAGIAGKKSPAKAIRDQMLVDGTAMCLAVKDSCL
ncbi:hypothetical protein [Paraburkholderia graminis]|uniref:hypothetical protein n=1 Tax=Paraburkholderia graminis TaxID=60548 RepID=UPI0038BAA942